MGYHKHQQELIHDSKILFNRVKKQDTIHLDRIPLDMVLNLINNWSMTTITRDDVKNKLKEWINTK